MKASFNKYVVICFLSIALFSCAKESTNDSAAATNTTGTGGSLSKFTIVGHFLYAVDGFSLYSYDISDPSHPVQTNETYLGFGSETIYPFNNRLFVGAPTGMYIFSLDQPGNPVQLGAATHARSCDPVVANDSIAFVTLKGNSNCGPAISGLYVHDIRNLLHPALIKTLELPNPQGLGLDGSTLYVCCNNDGLKVLNVLNPANPVVIRTLTGPSFIDVIPYGNLLICYVATGIMLYDISDRSNPLPVKLIEN